MQLSGTGILTKFSVGGAALQANPLLHVRASLPKRCGVYSDIACAPSLTIKVNSRISCDMEHGYMLSISVDQSKK